MIKSNKSYVLWFTGLSGSGKTTISILLNKKLKAFGKSVYIIDGDAIRDKIHTNLGFSRDDIRTNNKLIAELAKSLLEEYDIILVPIISPYNKDRKMAKNIIGNDRFIEVFINVPIEECINRDPKGLYTKALNGEIANFIGIAESNPYETPQNPDIVIDTLVNSKNDSVNKIIDYLIEHTFVDDSL
tara:strand:+ start:437 stop:994 length:558 start_codon:yes stop_codon:yes gene_type:complete